MLRQIVNKRIAIGLLVLMLILAGIAEYANQPFRAKQFILLASNQSDWPEFSIFATLPDGSKMRKIGKGYDPSCSPDGTQIAFVKPVSSGSSPRSISYSQIFIMDSNGNDKIQLTSNPSNASQPSWSPDGQRLAFMSYTIEILDLETLEVTRPFEQSGLNVSDPVWSPTGDRLVFSAIDVKSETRVLYISTIDGSNLHQFTDGDDEKPAWSPDGKHIAFLHIETSDQEGRSEESTVLRTMDLSRESWHDFQFPPGVQIYSGPKWSPDGQHVLIVGSRLITTSLGKESRNAIYSIDVGSSTLSIILTAKNTLGIDPPGWFPVSRQVHFQNLDWCFTQ